MPFNDTARAASIARRQSRATAHAAATLLLIQQAQAAGAKTNVAVAEYLNERGSRSPLNCSWTAQRISLVLRQAERARCP